MEVVTFPVIRTSMLATSISTARSADGMTPRCLPFGAMSTSGAALLLFVLFVLQVLLVPVDDVHGRFLGAGCIAGRPDVVGDLL